jgi:AbrB family looped-hinge helix DNA binding protein
MTDRVKLFVDYQNVYRSARDVFYDDAAQWFWEGQLNPHPGAHRRAPRLTSTANPVILTGMTHVVGPKGQVVIPKQLRDEFGIEPGDEVVFWRDGDHVAVKSVKQSEPLRGRFDSQSLTADLERDRAEDRQREGRR